MDDAQTSRPEGLAPDEKLTPVMVYTQDILARGLAVTKENIRVSIWLRTQGMPEYIHLKQTNLLVFGGSLQTHQLQDCYIPTQQVAAFHMLPPAVDPMDYDPSEANRKMEPITALVGTFRFNGKMRMSTQTDFSTFLTISRSSFFSIYDIEITNNSLQGMGVLRVPMALIRPSMVTFASRQE
jgi:hypothetical protein